ncbi:MAG: hypothetical protein M1339_04615 [Bacteroidetes bacterium]|nr:hypothetical protein [Bacteroidota bacterium]
MVVSFARTIVVRVLLASIAIVTLLYTIIASDNDKLIEVLRFFVVASAIVFVPVSEEFSHAAACIQLGKSDRVYALTASRWRLAARTELLIESFGVHFKGKMSANELLKITAAGPLFSLCMGLILLAVFYLAGILGPQASTSILLISLTLVIMPILSIAPVPYKFPLSSFSSDGHVILKIKRQSGISVCHLLIDMSRGLLLTFSFLIRPKAVSSADERN